RQGATPPRPAQGTIGERRDGGRSLRRVGNRARMSLFRATFTVGGLTAISRVLGFIRDVLMARILGAGLVADCFVLAFKLPNFFRRLFAEGAFSAAFVPMFSGLLEGEGLPPQATEDERRAAAIRFAEQSLAVLFA